jgi:lipid-A-disaccharide synthase
MKLFVVTGEASGDLQAAAVVHELRREVADLEVVGMGGDHLRREGVRTVHDIKEMGVVGLFNVLKHLPMFRRVFADLLREIEVMRPDAVLLVDYPDFNLRLAKRAHELGCKVIYYISPQVWAWRKGRIHHIAKYIDHMIVIFPFEEAFYREHGVPVTYVGHPLVEQLVPMKRERRAVAEMKPLKLALLPGSRRSEVSSLLEPMLRAVALLRRERALDAVIIKAPTIDVAELQRVVDLTGVEARIVEQSGRETLAGCDLAFASSGTATLETAVLGVPLVVMYRLSGMTYRVVSKLIKLPHFSLVNIVAGREVVPELIQHEVTGENIASAATRLLDPEIYRQTCDGLAEVTRRLGEPGASARAATAIRAVVESRA